MIGLVHKFALAVIIGGLTSSHNHFTYCPSVLFGACTGFVLTKIRHVKRWRHIQGVRRMIHAQIKSLYFAVSGY